MFDTAGLIGGNEVFKDRETGSRWQQSSLEAISGPLKGTHLALYPFLLTKWSEWRKRHPDTLVLKPLPGYAGRLPEMNNIISQGVVGLAGPAPKGAFSRDTRLHPKDTIVGLETGGEAKAYAMSALRRVHVVNDTVGGTPVLIVHQPASDTTTAFLAQAGPVFAYLLEGEIENQVDPNPPRRYKAGEFFYEPPMHVHRSLRNLSDTQAAKLLIFEVGEKGKPFTIGAH